MPPRMVAALALLASTGYYSPSVLGPVVAPQAPALLSARDVERLAMAEAKRARRAAKRKS